MATAPCPFPFHAACASPSFSAAATYLDPLPVAASAYAPVPCFSLPIDLHSSTAYAYPPPASANWPIWLPPPPPAPSIPAPTIPTTTSVYKMQPDSALLLEHFDAFHTSASRRQPDHAPAAFTSHSSSSMSSSASDLSAPAKEMSKVDAFQRHATGLFLDRLPSSSTTNKNDTAVLAHSPLDSAPEVFGEMPRPNFGHGRPVIALGYENRCSGQHRPTPSTPAQVPSTPVTGGRSSTLSWLLDTGRTPSTRERTPLQASFDSVHGELSKLSAAVSQLAVAMGVQTTEVLVPGPPLLECTASAPLLSNTTDSSPLTTATTSRTNSARLFPVCSMHTSTGTASAVPQVFGEMPTPQSGYEYCPGHHNISLNTCVLDRNSNLSEQNMDGMPQAYGVHNLNCKSVVLEPMFAVYEDETDSSSSEFSDEFATPTDRLQSQPFEQLPVFDVYDDDTEGFSNESVDVFAIKSEKQQIGISLGMHIQDGTSQCQASCFGTHRDVQFSEVPIYDVNGEETKGYSSENEIPRPPPPIFATASDQVKFQTSERMPESDDCSHAFVHVFESNPEQQPYEEEQQETAQFLTCISKATGTEESSACLNMVTDVLDVTLQLQPQDDERALNCPVFQASDSIVTSSNQASIELSMKALVWLHSPLFSHLHNQLQRSNTFSVWDPGILNQLDMMLDKIAMVHLVHHILTCELFSFIRQPADLKPFWTQFPFQYYSWYNATNALLEGLYVHMIQIVDCMGSARLPPTQISTHASSNTELAVLALRYYSLHPHQITNWTSTTSNGTTSAEYAYTLDFIIDQWELHKQGVQKSYSAMSSPNYLQILEMNILFITFLPP